MAMLIDYIKLQIVRARTLHAYRSGDWRKLPIIDCGERLVQVPIEDCHPYYAREMKLIPDERVFLREGVLARFQCAQREARTQGYDLKVYDGWRSIELQENLFWFYLREFTAAKFELSQRFASLDLGQVRDEFNGLPEVTQTSLREANRVYVSWPSKDPKAPSPHATGGAIDVWLYQNGVPVNLGVPFDWMEEDAGAFYHFRLRRSRFKGNDRTVCWRREVLLLAMVKAGFTCYGPEIWHFNCGNQMDALVRGGPARYSYITP